ncbi:molybdate ABC transporter substrate-binding protein [Microbacterium sp. P02]|uniref:molybdate ABC transporter substrate-binding protein n=1 Tax=Microbacterium sp. P02 TaxID=3366260 RepID=UPI00366DD21F
MSRIRRALTATAVAASVALAVAGCTASTGESATVETPSPTPVLGGDLTVFAAASLSPAFDEISAAFEAENPAVDVQPIVYDGSSTLATQLLGGASADVFASADEKNMAKVVDQSLASVTTLFASNTLVIAVPKGNPAQVDSITDLARPDVLTVLCAPEVPCGAASQRLLGNADLLVRPVSEEQNVSAVLTKVAVGEADAGLVYATDVIGRDDVESIVPRGAADVINEYPITVMADAPNPDVAAAFIEFVTGPEGQKILADLGFGAP